MVVYINPLQRSSRQYLTPPSYEQLLEVSFISQHIDIKSQVSISCKAMQDMDAILQLVQFPCLALFSALRIYGLLDGKYLLASMACLLNLVPFATNLFIVTKSIVVADFYICTTLRLLPNVEILLLTTIARIMVIVGDILVLAVTWSKTASLYLEARQLNMKAPLATILFRDGTIYFIILLILNVLEVARDNVPTLTDMNLLGALFSVLPSIIVCRFILNLRQIEPAGSSWASGSHSVSLRFVGNMGQSLRIAGEEEGEDEDELHTELDTANAGLSPESNVETIVEAHGDAAGNC
ncbi:hypothetical protein BC629DRAFT_790149 [Irpex lacteus]|nr:hypothetical protein BC629DRAFT_790149 [Irpex lacteus]